jgi:A/G-specific adenine glycosylase
MQGLRRSTPGLKGTSTRKGQGFELKVQALHATVFGWFRVHGRDLPWRHTQDAYAIAISEIMLQQTQVDRVIPKWRAFLHAFPTWADLADAKTSDVLRLWKGLGYNRRAVMLHRLSQSVRELGGELPNDIAAMKKLPGIGEYTANAVAAFAFRNPDAAPVDTNIIRILRRVFPQHASDPKSMQKLAQRIRPKDVWTWNHALMDIGALHCSARGHVWGLCPLAPLHGAKERPEHRRGSHASLSNPEHSALLADRQAGAPVKLRVRFEDTDRYFRGRIVDQLREGPMTMKKLRALPVFVRIDDERFATLVKRVVHDGVAEVHKNTVFLSGDGEFNPKG